MHRPHGIPIVGNPIKWGWQELIGFNYKDFYRTPTLATLPHLVIMERSWLGVTLPGLSTTYQGIILVSCPLPGAPRSTLA